MALYRVEHLTFAYPVGEECIGSEGDGRAERSVGLKALSDVSLSVEEGSFTVLCGASGCGKTTLLRLMKSTLAPHGCLEGSLLFDGRPLAEVPLREQTARIGFVMQIPEAQLVATTVQYELAFGLENLGVAPDEMRLRMAEMASFFGIGPWFRREVSELSGGQKQLLNLAAVMAMHPDVLLLDEPTAQLDPIAASEFLGAVAKANRELGCTVVVAEHRLEDVLPLADQVIVLNRGSIAAQGAPRGVGRKLWQQESPVARALPTPLRVALAVGDETSLPLTVREGRAWLRKVTDGVREPACIDSNTRPSVALLRLDNLWFRYEREAADVLRGASLEVPAGAITALMGGNGAGKSTLLRIIAGALKPYRGKVRWGASGHKDRRTGKCEVAAVGLLPQDPRSLFAHATVREELQEMKPVWQRAAERDPAALDSWEEAAQRTTELCALEPLLAMHPLDLSGGEQQRVALAKVLLARPRLLLLDEPTKGLDAGFKESLAALLRSLAEGGATVLMVSHDVEFCAQHADRVALLFDGEVVAEGDPRQFFAANSFYTTAANRMSRGIVDGCITEEDVVRACLMEGGGC